jgi:uncharacterized protein
MAFDPDALRELAKASEPENRALIRRLRRSGWSSRRLAKLQKQILERVWTEIHCTDCANCCRRMQLEISPTDCRSLARLLGMVPRDFRAELAVKHRDGQWFLRQYPCRFLEGSRCTIYEVRPSRCRGFPYLGGTVRDDDTAGTLLRARYCPAVFRVLEELRAYPSFQPRPAPKR